MLDCAIIYILLIIEHNVDVSLENKRNLYYKSRNFSVVLVSINQQSTAAFGHKQLQTQHLLLVLTISCTLLKHDGCKHLFNDRSCIYCVEITGLIAVFEGK